MADIASPEAAKVIDEVAPTTIYHLAAQISVPLSGEEPITDAETNIIGSLNLLEAARRCADTPKFVFVSTGGAIYGDLDGTDRASEDMVCRPISPYGASKLAMENYLRVYRNLCGLRYGIVRPGNVFGPRQTSRGGAGVVPIFANAMMSQAPITIFGDGTSFRDYIYVDDLVDGIRAVARSDDPNPFNIASGKPTSVNEVFEALNRRIPYEMTPNYLPERPTDVPGIVLDVERARNIIGWNPTTDFDTGIAQTVDALVPSS